MSDWEHYESYKMIHLDKDNDLKCDCCNMKMMYREKYYFNILIEIDRYLDEELEEDEANDDWSEVHVLDVEKSIICKSCHDWQQALLEICDGCHEDDVALWLSSISGMVDIVSSDYYDVATKTYEVIHE